MKRSGVLLFLFLLFLVFPEESFAASNQFGETGLLSMATAETVGSNNLCVGCWYDFTSMKEGGSNKIMPLSLTFGMTKNLEINASYPNILFNDDADFSERGYMNVGVKYRLLGTNRSPLKLAFTAAMLKSVNSDPSRSGITDYEGKVLFGVRTKSIKYHLLGGYRTVDDSLDPNNSLDDEIFVGAAVDISFHRRFRTFVEGEWRASWISGEDDTVRVTPGVQIFITPHLTFSGGVDFYLSDADRDWRIIAGISTCGGLGEYIVPIPKPPKPIIAELEKPRTKPPIPILPKMVIAKRKRIETEELAAVPLPGEAPEIAMEELAPVSRYEVAIAPGEEEVVTLPPIAIPVVEPAVPGLPPITAPPAVLAEVPRRGRTIRKFRIPELMFDFNRWTLRSESVRAIVVIAEEMLRYEGEFFVRIEGHTDSIGSAAYNEMLSLQRATAVAAEMIEKYSIPPERVFIEGYGESMPIASNETPEGRRANRRVDILLIVPEQ